MINVVLVDDEIRVCKSIETLIDWDSLGMQVVGEAHSGIEALELIYATAPDIVITDIQISGYSGIELIQKAQNMNVDFIIVSGCANFEYAQIAIKYGVSDYIIKPINKLELMMALEKLRAKHEERNSKRFLSEQLEKQNQSFIRKIRANYISNIFRHDNGELTVQQLNGEHNFNFKDGLYQGFCICLDFKFGVFDDDTLRIINKSATEIVLNSIHSVCIDCELSFTGSKGFGICNFLPEFKDDLRKKFCDCISLLQSIEELYPDAAFTIGIGFLSGDSKDIMKSILTSVDAVNDRILVGNDKLIEYSKHEANIHIPTIVKNFSILISSASELFDQKAVPKAISCLKEQVFETNSVRGREIFALITSAGECIISQLENPKNVQTTLHEFSNKCEFIGTSEELFLTLEQYATGIVERIHEMHKYNEARPIRLARQFIEQNYMNPISLDDVARAVGFNASYFSSFFKKGHGTGFLVYLSEVRINHAKIILKETSTPIYQVCQLVGYYDLKHFTKTFKKYTNLKPSEYRKLYG